MPYKIKGKCIYKKDTGKKVGCTDGDVDKYLKALQANVHEAITSITLNEDISDLDTEDIVGDIELQLNKAAAAVEKRQTESVVATTLGLILSGPFLLKIFAKVLAPVEDFFRKNKNDSSSIVLKINEFAEEMEHKLEEPLIRLAKTFTNEESKQKKFADGIIAGLLIISAGSVVNDISVKFTSRFLAMSLTNIILIAAKLTSILR
jgi:hypothetical protein